MKNLILTLIFLLTTTVVKSQPQAMEKVTAAGNNSLSILDISPRYLIIISKSEGDYIEVPSSFPYYTSPTGEVILQGIGPRKKGLKKIFIEIKVPEGTSLNIRGSGRFELRTGRGLKFDEVSIALSGRAKVYLNHEVSLVQEMTLQGSSEVWIFYPELIESLELSDKSSAYLHGAATINSARLSGKSFLLVSGWFTKIGQEFIGGNAQIRRTE